MVHIKVSNGVETRRFQVTEELTIEQLQEKLVSIGLFSSTVDKALSLQYQDSDGDVITISSNEELQTALSDLSSDAVLKLHMKRPTAPRPRRRQQSLFGEIFGQSTNFWDQFEKQFNTTESVLEQLWGNSGKRNGCCNTTVCCEGSDSTTEEKRTEPSDEEAVKSNADTAEPTGGEEVKSKVEDEPVKSKPSETRSPQVHSRTVVSWEPRVQYTWFGPRTVLRPVRYNVLYVTEQESPAPAEKTVSEQAKTTPEATPQETAVH